MATTTMYIDKAQLLEHLHTCTQLSKDENVKRVLQNLRQEIEDGEFDSNQD
jgi:hypothetical protein